MPKDRGTIEKDVRLLDYANASLPTNDSSRLSKKASNFSARALRESKDWWELEAEDFDPSDESDAEDDDIEKSPSTLSVVSKKKRSKNDQGENYNVYPIDFFFLIASYIMPEDVGRFALLSKRAYFVTRSAAFWKYFYNRFYKFSVDLPERYRPRELQRLYGLRTCVIKSFYFIYAPFVQRVKRPKGISLDGEAIRKLCRSVCVSFWHEQKADARGAKMWHYFFKFSLICGQKRDILPSNDAACPLKRWSASKVHRRIRALEDVSANLEDNCCVLKVVCTHFTQISTILGFRMSEVSISLNSDMRSHRVKLIFEPGNSLKVIGKDNSHSSAPKEVAVLDGVQSVALLDWWHPNYPLPVV